MKGTTIFAKLFTAFMILTLLLIGILWFMQTQFLEGYYFDQRTENLEERGRELVREIQPEGQVSEEVSAYLDQQSQVLGSEIALFSRQGEMLYETDPRGSMPMMGMGRRGNLSGEVLGILQEEGIFSTREIEEFGHGNMAGRNQDRDLLSTYVMGEEIIIRLQTTLNPIQEGIQVTQDFYLWILLFGGILAFVLSFIFSRRIAKPIEDLNQVAKEMNRMNFDVRYRGEEKGEVGELGNTLNHLTISLKETINQLHRELEKEKNLKNLRREFIARVSHELKTPIAVIKGYAEALEDRVYEKPEDQQRYLRILQEESTKMDLMLREILDLSRLETKHVELKEEAVDIKNFTKSVMEKMQAIDPGKTLDLQDQLKESEVLVQADPYRLEQILSNFLKNAIEHGEGHQIEVRIKEAAGTSGPEKIPGEQIRMEIKNQGPPLSESDQKKVWESFYKREEKKGSGLGLSIVEGLLALMDSDFGTYNESDGVVFYFSLKKLKK